MHEHLVHLAEGNTAAHKEVLRLMDQSSATAAALVDVAIRRAGDRQTRLALDAHLQDFKWSNVFPLHLQELATPIPGDPRFHEGVTLALASSPWWPPHRDALRKPTRTAAKAARKLLGDLDAIAQEAAVMVKQITEMRKLLDGTLHVLQTQALLRLELAGVTLAGAKTLEVGPQEGLLLNHLRKLGADACAVDLQPQISAPYVITGDFMHAALPGPFDVLVATAVFEEGSGWTLHLDDPRKEAALLLDRFKSLTHPGSVVVLEHVGYPVPFTTQQAAEHGFDVIPHRVPSAVAHNGARGCALRRR